MSRTTEQARKSIAAAEAEVLKWRTAEQTALDAHAAALATVPESEDDLDRIANAQRDAKSRATLAGAAARRAGDALEDARRALLRAVADDEQGEARSAVKALKAHQDKVDALVAQINKVEGVDYLVARHRMTDDEVSTQVRTGHVVTMKVRTSTTLRQAVAEHVMAEALLRYVAEHDCLPDRGIDLVGSTPLLPDNAAVRMFVDLWSPIPSTYRPKEIVDYLALRNPAAPVVEYEAEEESPHEDAMGRINLDGGHYHGDGCGQRLTADRQNLKNGYGHLVSADSPARVVPKTSADGVSLGTMSFGTSSN